MSTATASLILKENAVKTIAQMQSRLFAGGAKPEEYFEETTLDALNRYIYNKIPPGDFLKAVLSNDLKEAFGRADETNQAVLFFIVMWLYQNAPAGCWGSRDNYYDWLNAE